MDDPIRIRDIQASGENIRSQEDGQRAFPEMLQDGFPLLQIHIRMEDENIPALGADAPGQDDRPV